MATFKENQAAFAGLTPTIHIDSRQAMAQIAEAARHLEKNFVDALINGLGPAMKMAYGAWRPLAEGEVPEINADTPIPAKFVQSVLIIGAHEALKAARQCKACRAGK